MTAAPFMKLHLPPADEAPVSHGGKWYWLDEAEQITGVSEGNWRRRCAKEFAAQGRARQERRPNGQLAWQIHESADPRLARPVEPAARVNAVDVSFLTDAQRAEFSRRLKLIHEWRAALEGGFAIGMVELDITERFVAKQRSQGVPCSRGTLYRLRDRYDREGEKGLLDGRWITGDARPTESRFEDALKRAWLTQRKLSMRVAYELACERVIDEGGQPPSYTTAKRILNAIPKATVELMRFGKKSFEDNVETYIDCDYSTLVSNEIWCSDHHRFDVWVRIVDRSTGEEKVVRPWLHAWEDMRSRKVVGWSVFAGDPNAEIISRVLTGAIRTCGAPQRVYLDNGKDFDSRIVTGLTKQQRRLAKKGELSEDDRRRLGGLCSNLGIAVDHAWRYHGQSKPIERWFRTVSERFSKLWDTYCGKDVASKPDDMLRKIDAGQAPTLEDFTAAFAQYVSDGYNARPGHLGDSMAGKSPDQVWVEQLQSRRSVPDELLRFAALVRVEVTVRQNAVVQLPKYEVRYGRGERELIDRIGQRVVIGYDPEDLGEVVLIDPIDGRALCKLLARDRVARNATTETLRPAIAEKKRVRKVARDYAAARPKMSLDVVELAAAAAARQATEHRQELAKTGTADVADVPMAIVRTPFDASSTVALREDASPTRFDPNALRDAFAAGPRPTSRDDVDRSDDTFSILSQALAREGRRD